MNYILGVILATLISYQYYQSTLKTNYKSVAIEKLQVYLGNEKVRRVLQKAIIKTKTSTKTKKVRLRHSAVKYVGYGFSKNKIYALINNGKKSMVVEVGDDIGGSKVVLITKNELKIQGFKVILLTKPESREVNQANLISMVVEPVLNKTVVGKPSPTVKSTKTNKFTTKIIKEKERNDKYIVLRSIVNEFKSSPSSINKYFSFKKELGGFSIYPRAAYTNLFYSIGFKTGDKIIKVNNKSVNSISLILALASTASANKIKILLLNQGKYRELNVNLMKVYKN